jgi:hypothetical protein
MYRDYRPFANCIVMESQWLAVRTKNTPVPFFLAVAHSPLGSQHDNTTELKALLTAK